MAQDPIVTLLIIYLTTPKTQFYLPKLLAGSSNPSLEPFTTATLGFGQQSVMGLNMDITLTNVRIAGITNCQIAKTGGKPVVTVNGNAVTFSAIRPNTEAPPPNVPTDLKGDSGFVITPAGSTALPPGTAKVNIAKATIDGTFTATSANGMMPTATVTFTSLNIKAPLGDNIAITASIDSAFTPMINSVLNTPGMQQRLLDEVNKALNGPSVLAAVSAKATDAARNAFAQFGQMG